jgi:hypothetical protein
MRSRLIAGTLVAALVHLASAPEADAQHAYVAERATSSAGDAVTRCLDKELERHRTVRQRFTVTTVSPGGGQAGATTREAVASRSAPPAYIDSYRAVVSEGTGHTVAQVIAQTTRVEVTGGQRTQREVPARDQARRVADRAVAKCAPPLESGQRAEPEEPDEEEDPERS